MRPLYDKILNILYFIPILFLLSCSDSPEKGNGNGSQELVRLSLNLSEMSRASTPSDIEVINSIRIIIFDASGRVEQNHYDDKLGNNQPETFSYNFECVTTVGYKHIYVIANEESISNFGLEGINNNPQQSTLSEFLASFTYGSIGFEEMLNQLYFKPDFTKPIPVSCFYELLLKDSDEDKEEEAELYLVNTATKFLINFVNYRNEDVVFTGISLLNVADENFLIPQIAESDRFMEDKYWIDWLKDVSDETNKYPDLDDSEESNDLVNEKWGWLTNYFLPSSANHNSGNFIESETWTVPSLATNAGVANPGTLTKGPFYFPESKNIISNGDQGYSLEFEIQDASDPQKTIVLDSRLHNLKTMFRNTNMIINVEMYKPVEEIYVEIKRWVEQSPAYGTVVPE